MYKLFSTLYYMNTIEVNPEEATIIREKIMKCKLIALNEMDKHPLTNPKYLSKKEKEELIKRVREVYDNNTLEELNSKFNDVCNDKLFGSSSDISTYPVYVDKRFPEQQKKLDEEEADFEKLKEDIKTNKLIENTEL